MECCDRFTSRKNFGDRLSQYYEHLYDTYYDRAVEEVPMGCPVGTLPMYYYSCTVLHGRV